MAVICRDVIFETIDEWSTPFEFQKPLPEAEGHDSAVEFILENEELINRTSWKL